ncbi:MAG: ABC transporter permease [Planctomyces sp.]
MLLIGLKMLVGDRFKFAALVFTIASCAFLISQQVAIFTGLMVRTTSQIRDVGGAVWAMDPSVRYIDELRPIADEQVHRVRSVPGVGAAFGVSKSFTRATVAGQFRQAVLLGVDDHTLFGAPGWMVVGDAAALREPDGIIIDDRGFAALFPGQPLRVGDEIELSDRRAKIVGICRVSPPFATFPVIYAKISDARRFVGRERNFINFVVANPDEGVSADELSERIAERTGLKAMPASAFAWRTVLFYIANTGIPVNFGITICVAVIVGVVITGQTFLVFVFENIKVFAGLKAMGTTQRTLSAMIVLQALTVGVLGLGIGLGACAVFFDATAEIPHLRNFRLYPQILAGTSAVMLTISVLASIAALVRVGKVEPATVFRA